MTRDARLEAILAEVAERRELGETVDAAALLAAHPDLADDLRAALAALDQADNLLPARSRATGASIASWRIVGEIGRGAVGHVLRVADRTGATFALKLLQHHARADRRARERFRRETGVLRQLDHPDVVRMVDAGEADGEAYVVMEEIAGRSLAELVQEARGSGTDLALSGDGAPWQRACRLVARIARALHAAHEAGVLHRDLKPANVLVRAADGTGVLIDFGLAHGDGAAESLTATGEVLGTPHYMAPEQARGAQADARTDVYGLGAVLYELLTLSPPHRGTDSVTVLAAVRAGPPRPPRTLAPRIPAALDHCVRRAMAFRSAHRFASAADLATVLDALADGRRSPRATLSLGQRVGDFWSWHRRRLLIAAAALVAALGTWLTADLGRRARAAERSELLVAASTAYLDADPEAVSAAASRLAAVGEAGLAAWLQAPTAPAGDDCTAALAAAEALPPAEAEAAIPHLQRAVRARGELALPVALLGIAANRARQYELAERELTAAARTLPRCVRVRAELAAVHHERRQDAAAVGVLREATALAPLRHELWHELAKALQRTKDYAGGLAAVDRSIALQGGGPTISQLRTRGAILDGLGRKEEALADLGRVVASEPTAGHWMNYALVLDGLDRFVEARAAYEESLRLEPAQAPALFNLAFLHAGSKRDTCPTCRAFFAAHPDYLDPALVEQYALRLLEVQQGQFSHAEAVAHILARAGRFDAWLARVDALLREDFDERALGRLARARNVLRRR